MDMQTAKTESEKAVADQKIWVNKIEELKGRVAGSAYDLAKGVGKHLTVGPDSKIPKMLRPTKTKDKTPVGKPGSASHMRKNRIYRGAR